jgi:hypothetical protein
MAFSLQLRCAESYELTGHITLSGAYRWRTEGPSTNPTRYFPELRGRSSQSAWLRFAASLKVADSRLMSSALISNFSSNEVVREGRSARQPQLRPGRPRMGTTLQNNVLRNHS